MTYTQRELELLNQAVTTTNERTPFYALAEEMANLVANNLVEGNSNIIDPATGAIAFRARPEGIAAVQNMSASTATAQNIVAALPTPPAPPTPPAQPPAAPLQAASGNFQVGGGFAPPARNPRKSVGKRKYPFEDLELFGWFFVPSTPEKPNPKKSLASVISGKNKEFENFAPRRYFQAYHATKGQIFGNLVAPSDGCYIVRVEPPVTVAKVAE